MTTGLFRIASSQFGYPMYAAELPLSTPPWSDQIAEAHLYDERDSRETKLAWWRGLAKAQGLNPESVQIVEA